MAAAHEEFPMKIYGNPMSTCTRKVLATLAEKHAKFDFATIDFATGEHKKPDYLAHQPFGQIPALEDGDLQMYESRAMIRYIDEIAPGQSLTPKDPKARARMEQWMSVETSNFTPHAMAYVYQHVFVPMHGGKPDLAKVEEAKPKLEKALDVMDKHLAKGPHFVGDQFTLADICFMPYFEYAMNTPAKDLINARPNVAAWWKRVSERPSWKTATGPNATAGN
jgi:glutathione S-transferase